MESLFTEIDEEFICENCGKKVKKLGYSCRNHCNYCLHSKHVDINPGDRSENCHGTLEPVGIEINNKTLQNYLPSILNAHGWCIIKNSKQSGNNRVIQNIKVDQTIQN